VVPGVHLNPDAVCPGLITGIRGDSIPTILIVDDNAELVQLYALILRGNGYQVYSAGDGERCFSFLETITPDLIILDIMMEPMDGWEVLSRIRRSDRSSGIPVIMVSGKKPTHDEAWQYMEWVDDYRVKPLSVKGLKGVVTDFFASRAAIDREISQVECKGAGEKVLAEYRGLRRSIAAGTAMMCLLEMADVEITSRINEKEKRLKELQVEYGVSA
jgi:DNA-binding response OmpR family regulator